MRYGMPLTCLLGVLATLSLAAQQPEAPEEPEKLNEVIENAAGWYDLFPDDESTEKLKSKPIMRWRNVSRGQKGEAMMVVWHRHGRPQAMASIYPWLDKMVHEFDSLSREGKLIAKDDGRVVWMPSTPGVEFKDVPDAPEPAKNPLSRLRQMKKIAKQFKAIMTGWAADDSDREELRPLPRELFRYEPKQVAEGEPGLLDGAMFAYVQGTDPEVILLLEATGEPGAWKWQYAFARATSGGLRVEWDGKPVWTAAKHAASKQPTATHLGVGRPLAEVVPTPPKP